MADQYKTTYQCNNCGAIQVRTSSQKYSGNQGVHCPKCNKTGATVISCEKVD